jgi:hypothetical protein
MYAVQKVASQMGEGDMLTDVEALTSRLTGQRASQ